MYWDIIDLQDLLSASFFWLVIKNCRKANRTVGTETNKNITSVMDNLRADVIIGQDFQGLRKKNRNFILMQKTVD